VTLLAANLIPRARRDAQRVAARARAWALVVAGVGVALAIAWGALFNTYAIDAADSAAQLERADADLRAADAELKTSRAELAGARRLLDAAREVRDHPDWSILLGAMSRRKGDGVALASLDIAPADLKPSQAAVTRPSRYALRIAGVARDHRAATAFSLMLESTGVFSRVSLTDTATRSVDGHEVVAFGVECSLDENAEDAP
jgi:Tfp pilus assembly protein PilN